MNIEGIKELFSSSKYSHKTIRNLFILVVPLLILDLSLSKISDDISEDLLSNIISSSIIFGLTIIPTSVIQYIMYVKISRNYRESEVGLSNTRTGDTIFFATNCVILAINILIFFQVIISMQFNIFLLVLNVVLSYGSVIGLFFIFSKTLFSWFRWKRKNLLNYIILTIIYSSFFQAVALMHAYFNEDNDGMILISIVLIASYVVVIGLAFVSKNFPSWFRFNSTNIILLSYGLSSVLILLATLVTLVFFEAKLIDKMTVSSAPLLNNMLNSGIPSENTNLTSNFDSPNIPVEEPEEPGTLVKNIYLVRELKNYFIDVYFALIWFSTAILLRHNVRRMGKFTYWFVVTLALAYYIFAIFPVTQSIFGDNDISSSLFDTYSTLIGGLFASIGFWSISRNIKVDPNTSDKAKIIRVKNYLYLSAIGFFLFFLTGEASTYQTSFPPFGLANISFFCVASFMLITGLTYAVSSLSRGSMYLYIRKFAFDSAKLVGDLSTVEGEKKLTDNVLDRLKTTEKLILHDSTATESKEQVFDYIKEVITEIKKIRGK